MSGADENQQTEETPLLDNGSARSSSKERSDVSPVTLLIPVVLTTRLASQLPLTTFVDVVRQIICELWYAPDGDPIDGSTPEAVCDAPEVERSFSAAITSIGILEAITALIVCAVLSYVAARYGRKPVLLTVIAVSAMGCCLIAGAQIIPTWFGVWVLLAGIMFQSASNILIYSCIVNMYVVDVSTTEKRRDFFFPSGFGATISFALGGLITTKTNNPLIVYYLSCLLFVATFLYVFFFLPESFPKEKRDELRRRRLAETADGHQPPTSSLLFFEPLKVLIPSYRPDGGRNWRLVWCAVHIFIVMTATTYAGMGFVVLVTTKYHLTPVQTGLFLSIASISSVFTLTIVVPLLVRFLRPFFQRRVIHSAAQEEMLANDADTVESETSDRLDVHLGFVSWVICGVAYLCAVASTTDAGLISSAICLGASVAREPTFRSLVAGSTSPLKQGEALAAIEMVASIGVCISPIIMGSILTATISTMPWLVFYIHAVVVVIGGVVLYLVRDSDRHQHSHEITAS
ncbi:MFS general substrate transporter [Phlebopus sp. FC_14]|nr:MFS general substrate transporter [Phlebopus sp. FC_14]